MDRTEEYISEQNVGRYIDLLASDISSTNRTVCSDLLRAEEDRYVREAACLDAIEGWIAKCDGHIRRHIILMEKHVASGRDLSVSQKSIEAMAEMKAILLKLREVAYSHTEIAAEPFARKPDGPSSDS